MINLTGTNYVKCPQCNSEEIYRYFTCHTYLIDNKWYSCLPCDSAIEFFCDDCDWSFTWGLNENNPRFEREKSYKPNWLPDISHTGLIVLPDDVILKNDY